MASAFQKLLRKSPPTRLITAFHPSQTSNPSNPITALHRECHRPTPPTPSPVTEGFNGSSLSTVVFPSFPFGFASKPVFASGFYSPEAEDSGLEDSRTVWADSVKKKRKRKMNKHKYQKLRKRMRRQT